MNNNIKTKRISTIYILKNVVYSITKYDLKYIILI
jgi:hypothetical protein